jgi:hypothetical protein
MMFVHHHLDNASSVLTCLLGNRGKPGGSAESIHRSPSHGKAYQAKKRRLYRVQGELLNLTGNSLTTSILKQLVHWGQSALNFDRFIAEEKRAPLQGRFSSFSSFYHGWPTKSAQELLKKPSSALLFLFSIIIEEFLCLKL